MNPPKPAIRAILAVLAVALAGCASPAGPLSLSISELGSEVVADGGSWKDDLHHRRSHNISGMGAADVVGGLSTDPDPPLFTIPGFANKHLPDQLALRIDPGCSRVVVKEMPFPGTDEQGAQAVATLRNSLQRSQVLRVRELRLKAQAFLVDKLIESYPQVGAAPAAASSAASAIAAAPTVATTPDALATDRRNALLQAWSVLSAEPAESSRANWEKKKAGLNVLLAQVTEELLAAKQAIEKLSLTPGLVVANWEYETKSSGGLAAIGTTLGLTRADTRNGFVVLGHPRTVTLLAGDDLRFRVCSADTSAKGCADLEVPTRNGIDGVIAPTHLYTTTFQLMAKHVAWSDAGSADKALELSLQLKQIAQAASGAVLADLGDLFRTLDVSVSASSASHLEGQNQGLLSGSFEYFDPFLFVDDPDYSNSIRYRQLQDQAFFRISSMRSTLDAFGMSQAVADGRGAKNRTKGLLAPVCQVETRAQLRALMRVALDCAPDSAAIPAAKTGPNEAPDLLARRVHGCQQIRLAEQEEQTRLARPAEKEPRETQAQSQSQVATSAPLKPALSTRP